MTKIEKLCYKMLEDNSTQRARIVEILTLAGTSDARTGKPDPSKRKKSVKRT
jgi:hypothetical protein